MNKFKCFLAVCVTLIFVGCGSRVTNVQNTEGFEEQIALADSILLYFQQERFDKIVVHFDDKVKAQLNEKQLAAVWAQLNAQAGKYTKSEFYRAEKMNAVGDRVVYKCNFSFQRLYFQLVFGKDNRIIGIFFKPQPN